MDSLGRRVYGVEERTYERELRDYFDKNFEDRRAGRQRVSNRTSSPGQPVNEPSGGIVKKASDIAEGGMTVISQLGNVIRFLIMGVSFYMLFVAGKKLYEEMEKNSADNDQEPEGDVFDKMFGSEFKGKFKNARQNKGMYKKRQEELRLVNLKDENNTTAPADVRKLFSSDTPLVEILVRVINSSPEQYEQGGFIREIGECASGFTFFRVIYRGYTLRELMSPRSLKQELLKEAASYISNCLKTQ